jgi:hypothetical protein
MDEEEVGTSQRREPIRPTEDDPYAWIAEGPRTRSVITPSAEPKFTIVEDRIGGTTD